MRWRPLAIAITMILVLGAALVVTLSPEPITVLSWTDDQRAIQSYSISTAGLKDVQAQLVETWQTALNETEPARFQEELTQNVLPAMTAYVTTLESLPTQTEAIARIHGPFAAAWRRTLTTFEASLLAPSARDGGALLDPLIEQLTGAVEAGTTYRNALEALCVQHDITLTTPQTSPTPKPVDGAP